MDPARVRFLGKLITTAHTFGGSVTGPDTQPFVDSLFLEWKATNRPLDECRSWLSTKLKGVFESVGEPPVWVEDEPSWPFCDGVPMVFISQTSFGWDPFSRAKLSPGETVYLFAVRQKAPDAVRMVYRVVSQYDDSGADA